MKENKNISSIRKRLEPSSELKNRVMERAAKLEAGRKTFGVEMTTADNQEKQKEQIKMNAYNTNEKIKVKRNFPIAAISAAACAAIVIGIAAVNMNEKKPKTIPMTSTDILTTDDQTTDDQTSAKDDDSISEDVMTVTDAKYGTYTITDKDRIAAIDSIVEKAKTCQVWDGGKAPTNRILEYVIDGKKRTVKISEEQVLSDSLAETHTWEDRHAELCKVVTVDGMSYALCELSPDEPLSELDWTTGKGGSIGFQGWNDEDSFYEEYDDETTAHKLLDIIKDIRENGTPQLNTDDYEEWKNSDLTPAWENVRFTCSCELDGCYYDVSIYSDPNQIAIDEYDWHDRKTHYLLYKDTQNWTAQFEEVFDSLKDLPEVDFSSEGSLDEETEKVEIPELFDMTEEQVVEALKELGLCGAVEYRFYNTEKGRVFSWYDMSENTDGFVEKGTVIPILVSLGEYDGPNEALNVEFGTGGYPSKEIKLEVPVPEGLIGSYTFDIYYGGYVMYTDTFDSTNGDKSVTFDIQAEDKERFAVYAKKNGSAEENLIRYATYEFDYASEKWTLIGELNTKELLESMN